MRIVIQYVPLHQELEAVEAHLASIVERLLIGPVVVVNVVAGQHQADAVVTAPAMDEDGPSRRIFQHLQGFRHLIVVRLPQAREADADVLQAGGFRVLFSLGT